MQNTNLLGVIDYLVNQSIKLKDKFTTEAYAPIEFACIFCQTPEEYKAFTLAVEKIGTVVQNTPSGLTYQLNNPINTEAGKLKLVKIRTPDPLRKERGDTDFNTKYPEFKRKYQGKPQFELIERDNFEMLRLSDPKSDVMVCFSSIPLGISLNLK
jgi:hypothetical protein